MGLVGGEVRTNSPLAPTVESHHCLRLAPDDVSVQKEHLGVAVSQVKALTKILKILGAKRD